jgi:EAL domain-containing protein (putative c-di-GMP-specific phosphodiesterase class I)
VFASALLPLLYNAAILLGMVVIFGLSRHRGASIISNLRSSGWRRQAVVGAGTGYSSLAYLKKFSISYIKIDQSFVQNLSPEGEDYSICKAMITMAHSLGIKVIAEGIETAAQRALLIEAGCDFGQGFLFARSTSAAQLETCLQENPVLPADTERG